MVVEAHTAPESESVQQILQETADPSTPLDMLNFSCMCTCMHTCMSECTDRYNQLTTSMKLVVNLSSLLVVQEYKGMTLTLGASGTTGIHDTEQNNTQFDL